MGARVTADSLLMLMPAVLLASLLAALLGTGGGVLLLPLLVLVFGIRDAVPLYALLQLVGNLGRLSLNRAALAWPVLPWFLAGAVPAAVLGAWGFAVLPAPALQRLLGGFLLLCLIGRRCLRPPFGFPRWGFLPVGAVFGLVSAVAGSAGPFVAPFYLAHGLLKGAYIATEAAATAGVHVVKLLSYYGLGALPVRVLGYGLCLAPLMLLGAWLGRWLLQRMPVAVFTGLIDVGLAVFGLWFLFGR